RSNRPSSRASNRAYSALIGAPIATRAHPQSITQQFAVGEPRRRSLVVGVAVAVGCPAIHAVGAGVVIALDITRVAAAEDGRFARAIASADDGVRIPEATHRRAGLGARTFDPAIVTLARGGASARGRAGARQIERRRITPDATGARVGARALDLTVAVADD